MARSQGPNQRQASSAMSFHKKRRQRLYNSKYKAQSCSLRPRSLLSRSQSSSKVPRTTTHNHLTIHGGLESSKHATETPYVFLVYQKLLLKVSILLLVLYLVVNFIMILRTDINSRLEFQTKRLQQEIELCANEYRANRCFPLAERTKFIEKHCIEWERCMNHHKNLSKLKIGAETLAEVIDGFVDVLSFKTMISIFAILVGGIWATNFFSVRQFTA